ncbi:MAG: N-acetylmuramoyl-L-alanine amidase [Clostridia bacterium]|nr:N-acetylmuramoyl-L-alanine amidase [Clostridia bacterium]
MFKLALNAGHGYNTAGKRCLKSIDPKETREYVLNKRICDYIQKTLSEYKDIEVLRTDDGSEISVAKRAATANKFNADVYISVHHNAGIKGGKGGGIEAYVYLNVDSKTKDWQKSLYDSLISTTALKGNRAMPIKSANFGELRLTKMPAVLLECGFMDSLVDTPIILTDEFAQKAAQAIADTVIQKSGLKKTPTAKKTTEQIALEVIRGEWGNGAERKQRLAAAGYNYTTIQRRVNKILKG